MALSPPSPRQRRVTETFRGAEVPTIPEVPWGHVLRRVDRLWVPQQAPHHSLVAQNGAGKSYLIRHGLLEPMAKYSRVLIIDNKGDDPTLNGMGRPVRRLPRFLKMSYEHRPYEHWFRLVVYDDVDRERAKDQVKTALERVYQEGDWIVVLDETRSISDARKPGLGLAPDLERLWRMGRSRGVPVIAATQAPRWVPSSFYDQCQFVWISRIRDQRAHERVMEIGSMTRGHIPLIGRIRKRRWLYMDDEEDETFAGMTGL